MKLHPVASFLLVAIYFAAALPIHAAAPNAGANTRARPMQPARPASAAKGTAPAPAANTNRVKAGASQGEAAPSRGGASGNTPGPGFTNPDCGTYCQCGGGCNAVEPRKPVQNSEPTSATGATLDAKPKSGPPEPATAPAASKPKADSYREGGVNDTTY